MMASALVARRSLNRIKCERSPPEAYAYPHMRWCVVWIVFRLGLSYGFICFWFCGIYEYILRPRAICVLKSSNIDFSRCSMLRPHSRTIPSLFDGWMCSVVDVRSPLLCERIYIYIVILCLWSNICGCRWFAGIWERAEWNEMYVCVFVCIRALWIGIKSTRLLAYSLRRRRLRRIERRSGFPFVR